MRISKFYVSILALSILSFSVATFWTISSSSIFFQTVSPYSWVFSIVNSLQPLKLKIYIFSSRFFFTRTVLLPAVTRPEIDAALCFFNAIPYALDLIYIKLKTTTHTAEMIKKKKKHGKEIWIKLTCKVPQAKDYLYVTLVCYCY